MVTPDQTLGLVTFHSTFKLRRDTKDKMFTSLSEKPATSGWHTALINNQEADSGYKRNFNNFFKKKKKKIKGKRKKGRIPQEIEGNLGDRM